MKRHTIVLASDTEWCPQRTAPLAGSAGDGFEHALGVTLRDYQVVGYDWLSRLAAWAPGRLGWAKLKMNSC